MQVLDKGELRLIDFMGGDLSVVAAARVSNGVLKEGASKGEESDKNLINYLMRNRHGTPFEHSIFTFYVKCPIFVAREWMRHRIGSFNEISGRYTKFEPEYYIPDYIRVPASSNKQGSVQPNLSDYDTNWNESRLQIIKNSYDRSYNDYESLLLLNVAKEMARIVLPVGTYTQFYWTVNSRALANFCSLRSAENAQWEIRQYSLVIERIFEEQMPLTYDAWVTTGRLAP